ncbi:hypothetical protein [Planktothrix sp. FACHB-1365]|uniref:hypothetical protein n=1 Tax=Planktothrix sp. FACHB-1365 TaxID=2692855 RepID=UPI001687979B|nr:hypothetical protein [Planktothrix sp. FACHB-1365]MBD2485836.1 hypothetical protein [Planktothrix sp. FACHB-1365]
MVVVLTKGFPVTIRVRSAIALETQSGLDVDDETVVSCIERTTRDYKLTTVFSHKSLIVLSQILRFDKFFNGLNNQSYNHIQGKTQHFDSHLSVLIGKLTLFFFVFSQPLWGQLMCEPSLLDSHQQALQALMMLIYLVERTFRHWDKNPKSQRVADVAACTSSAIYCIVCVHQMVLFS